ncbi:MAG: hypothetical protein ONB05_04040 [candidate division KSB1 bacterium]|nr:hypothetical protein [candidate division KSB1 bacterium]
MYRNTLFILLIDDNQYFLLSKSLRRLLALMEIQTNTSLLETLTRQGQEELKKKFKEAEKQMPSNILNAYRYLAMIEEDGVNRKDLGFPTVGSAQTLSERVRQYLKDQEKLLSRLTPKYVIEKTLGKEETGKSVREIYELHLKTPGRPIPESEQVLLTAIIEGARTGILGIQKNGVLYYRREVSPDMDSIIIRDEMAKRLKQEEEGKEADKGLPPEQLGKREEIEEKKKGEVVRRLTLRAVIPWDKLSSLITGVIRPLKDKGLPPEITIEIKANSEQGFDRTTLDSRVKETLRQIEAKIQEWKEE